MKKKSFSLLLLVGLLLTLPSAGWAQLAVKIDTQGAAGKLAELLRQQTQTPETITDLTVTGLIDNDDVRAITDLGGLRNLDMGQAYGATEIPALWLYWQDSIRTVVLPEGIINIGWTPFPACHQLRELTLPSTVQTIEDGFFSGCDSLELLTVNADIPPVNKNHLLYDYCYCDPLEGMAERVELRVPNRTKIAYLLYGMVYPWSFFKTIRGSYSNSTAKSTLLSPLTYPYDFYYDELNLGHEGYDTYAHMDVRIPHHDVPGGIYLPQISLMGTFNIYYDNWNQAHNPNWDAKSYYATFINYTDPDSWYLDRFYNEQGHTTIYAYYIRTTINLNDGWNFISFPYDVRVADIITPSPNHHFVVRTYDGKARAAMDLAHTWYNLTEDSVLQAGRGYILYNSTQGRDTQGTPYVFPSIYTDPKKNDIFADTDIRQPLKQYVAERAHNSSWNLVGNPYPCYFDISYLDTDAPVVVYNHEDWATTQYNTYSPLDDEFMLHPGEAFFIQAMPEQKELRWHLQGRSHYNTPIGQDASVKARRAKAREGRRVFNLYMTDGASTCRTRLVVNEKATLGYDLGRDICSFAPMQSGKSVQFYSLADGVKYDINERPLADAIVKLGFDAPRSGEYTIRMETKAGDRICLDDLKTGITTDLSAGSYTFKADAGSSDSRFVLRLEADATGVSGVQPTAASEPARYNLQGQKVSTGYKGIVIENGRKVLK